MSWSGTQPILALSYCSWFSLKARHSCRPCSLCYYYCICASSPLPVANMYGNSFSKITSTLLRSTYIAVTNSLWLNVRGSHCVKHLAFWLLYSLVDRLDWWCLCVSLYIYLVLSSCSFWYSIGETCIRIRDGRWWGHELISKIIMITRFWKWKASG